MLRVTGTITDRDSAGVWATFVKTSCGSCHNPCGRSQGNVVETIYLSSQFEKRLEVSLSSRNLCSLVLNSLLFPVTGFVLGALIGDSIDYLFAAGELMTITLSLAGLMVGILCCRQSSLQMLSIKEVHDDQE